MIGYRTHFSPDSRESGQANVNLYPFRSVHQPKGDFGVATPQLLRGTEKDRTHYGFNASCHLHGGDTVGGLKPAARSSKNGGNPVPCCRKRIALCRVLLRASGARRPAAALWLFRATCADSVGGGALQHPCVALDDGAGEHCSGSGGFCTLDTRLPSVPRKFQGHLQREACDAAVNCVAVRDRSYRKPME